MNQSSAMGAPGIASEEKARGREVWPGDDFPTWLSPMLVRELRQGIQSGAFFWTFLLMQAALFLLATTALVGAFESPRAMMSQGVAGFYWAILGLAVGLVIPLRGMTAIASERAGNNLDLIQLTRLSATKIVVGKWAAIVAQAMLVAVAALPYLVLHYFFGGVNVIADLVGFAWLLTGSALVAAFAIFASTRPQRERVGLMLLAGVAGWVTLVTRFAPMGTPLSWSASWVVVVIPIFYIVLLLEAAAASIAPPAENHALRKRLIGLFCAGIIAVTSLVGSETELAATLVAFGIPLLVIGVTALIERPVSIYRVHAPFAETGLFGKALATVFTPGWATGLVFVAMVSGVTAGAVIFKATAEGWLQAALPVVSLSFAAILFPLPLVLWFPKIEARGTLYGMTQVAALVPWLLGAFTSDIVGSNASRSMGLGIFLPQIGLLHLMVVDHPAAQQMLFVSGLLVTAAIVGLIASLAAARGIITGDTWLDLSASPKRSRVLLALI